METEKEREGSPRGDEAKVQLELEDGMEDRPGEEGEEDEEGEGEDLDEFHDSSEEEEDDEEEGAEELQDFLADSEEDEEGAEGEGAGAEGEKKKKKKKKRRLGRLDEDDYALLEEQGINVNDRLKKRIRKAGAEEEGQRPKTREEVERDLFGDKGLEDDLEEAPAKKKRKAKAKEGAKKKKGPDVRGGAGATDARGYGEEEEEDDGLDDWLEDDVGGGEDEEGRPQARRRRRRGALAVDQEALEDILDIFGGEDELQGMLDEYEGAAEARAAAEGRSEGEEEEEPFDAEEEAALLEGLPEDEAEEKRRALEDKVAARQQREAERVRRRALKKLDPGTLARLRLTDRDEEITRADQPERFALRRGPAPPGFDPLECAQWIWSRLLPADPETAGFPSPATLQLQKGCREVEGDQRDPRNTFSLRGQMLDCPTGRRCVRRNRTEMEIAAWQESEYCRGQLLSALESALEYMYDAGMEPPVIGLQRKERVGDLLAGWANDAPETRADLNPALEDIPTEYIVPPEGRRLRRFDVLYEVEHLAETYRAFLLRRAARRAEILRLQQKVPTEGEAFALLERCLQTAEAAASPPTLDDTDALLRLALGVGQVELDGKSGPGGRTLEAELFGEEEPAEGGAEGGHVLLGKKGPRKITLCSLARESGLPALARQICRPSHELGLLLDAYLKNDAEGLMQLDLTGVPPLSPEGLQDVLAQAAEVPAIGAHFPSTDDVRKALVAVTAEAVAAEPGVRAFVRARFRANAVVSIEPTPAGERSIEAVSLYGDIKRIDTQLLRRMPHEAFLRACQAEKEGLVKVVLELVDLEESRYYSDLLVALGQHYCTRVDDAAGADALRMEVLSEALTAHLLPHMADELKAYKAGLGKKEVTAAVQDKIWQLCTRRPIDDACLQPFEDEGEEDVRALAISWGAGGGEAPTTAVLVDGYGNLKDYLFLPALSGDVRSTEAAAEQQVRRMQDTYSNMRSRLEDDQFAEAMSAFRMEALDAGLRALINKGEYTAALDTIDQLIRLLRGMLGRLDTSKEVVPPEAFDRDVPTWKNLITSGKRALDALKAQAQAARGLVPELEEDRPVFAKTAQGASMELLLRFILKHEPKVIVVGANLLQTRQLRERVDDVSNKILTQFAQKIPHGMDTWTSRTFDVDESVAQLWEHAPAAREEFKEHPACVRRCIGLARYALDPLAVLCALVGETETALAKLPTLPPMAYKTLSQAELAVAAEQILVTAVAQQGADINVCAARAWQLPKLAFVPGLGPRKAQALATAVARNADEDEDGRRARVLGFVRSRHELVKRMDIRKTVLRNCGASIKVGRVEDETPRDADAAPAYRWSALDQIRSPLSNPMEETVIALAAQATNRPDYGVPVEDQDDVLEEAMRGRGEKVWPLDVSANVLGWIEGRLEREADLLRRFQGHAPGLATLIDLQLELCAPFADLRAPYRPMDDESLFYLRTGETPQTLRPGTLLHGKVRILRRINKEQTAILTLDNGLEGLLPASSFFEAHERQGDEFPDLLQRLPPGTVTQVRVERINAGSYELVLNASKDYLSEGHWEKLYANVNKRYITTAVAEKAKADQKRRNARPEKTLIARPIHHPLFKNVTAAQAKELLRGKPVGECLMRPMDNPKQASTHIYVDIVVYRPPSHDEDEEPYIVTIAVVEGAKQAKDLRGLGSYLKLGLPLRIKRPGMEEVFEDLDEVQARFVEPFVAQCRAVFAHRKYKRGLTGSIDSVLRVEKQRPGAEGQASYCLNLPEDRMRDGIFQIVFIANETPYRENFSVTTTGVFFRDQNFDGPGAIERMLAEFKRDPTARAFRRQLAAKQAETQRGGATPGMPGVGGGGMTPAYRTLGQGSTPAHRGLGATPLVRPGALPMVPAGLAMGGYLQAPRPPVPMTAGLAAPVGLPAPQPQPQRRGGWDRPAPAAAAAAAPVGGLAPYRPMAMGGVPGGGMVPPPPPMVPAPPPATGAPPPPYGGYGPGAPPPPPQYGPGSAPPPPPPAQPGYAAYGGRY